MVWVNVTLIANPLRLYSYIFQHVTVRPVGIDTKLKGVHLKNQSADWQLIPVYAQYFPIKGITNYTDVEWNKRLHQLCYLFWFRLD